MAQIKYVPGSFIIDELVYRRGDLGGPDREFRWELSPRAVIADIDKKVLDRITQLQLMQSIRKIKDELDVEYLRYMMDEVAANKFWQETKRILVDELHAAGWRLVPPTPSPPMLDKAEEAINKYYDEGGTSLKEALAKAWTALTNAVRLTRD